MRTSQVLCALLLTLSSCAHSVTAVKPPLPWVNHGSWATHETTPDHFLLYVHDNEAAELAVKTLCTKDYICVGPEQAGVVMEIDRIPKTKR